MSSSPHRTLPEDRQRTKIVCTLGPSSSDEKTLRAMLAAGMSVARINFSHGTHAQHAATIALVRQLAHEMGHVLAVMADLQGPKIRIGEVGDAPMRLNGGREVLLVEGSEATGQDPSAIPVPHPELIRKAAVGDRVWLDDGVLELEVIEKLDNALRCRIVIGGPLVSRKGITIPGVSLDIPAMTDKDAQDLAFAVEAKVDYIAQSFVRSVADVEDLKQRIEALGDHIPVIAKIEQQEALNNFNEIIEVADGAMVARGDLGIHIPTEDVPYYQKAIIRRSNQAGKPVITATQMLHSMVVNPRPTRAEAGDVYNAILDGSDAVMLSAETAAGDYPVESVATMRRIAHNAEVKFPYHAWSVDDPHHTATVPEAIARATCQLAHDLKARAIVTSTWSGNTARKVAKYRPHTDIICGTPNTTTFHRAAMLWGVKPLLVPEYKNTDQMVNTTVNAAVEAGMLDLGDLVVVTGGMPTGQSKQTNLIHIHRVGEDATL